LSDELDKFGEIREKALVLKQRLVALEEHNESLSFQLQLGKARGEIPHPLHHRLGMKIEIALDPIYRCVKICFHSR